MNDSGQAPPIRRMMMDQERTQDDVARLLLDRFDPQWFFWSELTRGLRLVEEKECHQKKGIRDLSPWLSAIRRRTIPGISRNQSGNDPESSIRQSPVIVNSLSRKHGPGRNPRAPSGLFARI